LPAEPRPGFVAVGRIRSTRGVRGELRVEPLSDVPARFAPGSRLSIGDTSYTIEAAQPEKTGLLVKLAGVASHQAAEALRGRLLEIPESELGPLGEGEYFRFQIVGIKVFDSSGRPLGRVEEILPTGGNDVYVVRGPAGELLLPAIDDVIKDVDVAAGRMLVELLEGMEQPTSGRPAAASGRSPPRRAARARRGPGRAGGSGPGSPSPAGRKPLSG